MKGPLTYNSGPFPESNTPSPPIHDPGALGTDVHCEPFQRTRVGAPPFPDANSSGPPPWSYTSRSSTRANGNPAPIACHDEPFHFAMCSAPEPPALVNAPPAISAGPPPLPSSKTVSACTPPFIPGCPC